MDSENYVYVVNKHTDARQTYNDGEIISICKTKDNAIKIMETVVQSFSKDDDYDREFDSDDNIDNYIDRDNYYSCIFVNDYEDRVIFEIKKIKLSE